MLDWLTRWAWTSVLKVQPVAAVTQAVQDWAPENLAPGDGVFQFVEKREWGSCNGGVSLVNSQQYNQLRLTEQALPRGDWPESQFKKSEKEGI